MNTLKEFKASLSMDRPVSSLPVQLKSLCTMPKPIGTRRMHKLINKKIWDRPGFMPTCTVKKVLFIMQITGIAKRGKHARVYLWKRNGSN
jgi:hypothetical protein